MFGFWSGEPFLKGWQSWDSLLSLPSLNFLKKDDGEELRLFELFSVFFLFILFPPPLQVNLCQKLKFLQNIGRICCVHKLFWVSKSISVHNMFCPCSELGTFMYWTCNSINNMSKYCGLVHSKKELLTKIYLYHSWLDFSPLVGFFHCNYWRGHRAWPWGIRPHILDRHRHLSLVNQYSFFVKYSHLCSIFSQT